MSTQTLNDAQARASAIDPRGSCAVSAPAGSGKTELLIQRTLSLLGCVEQPEAILGITFTRKAASEMRERVSKALAMADSGQPVTSQHEQKTRDLALAALKRDTELGWGLLQNPSRLRFQTIDGLCRQLASQLCLETGIVMPPEMTADPKTLAQQAAERLIAYVEDTGPVGEHLRAIVTHLDNNLDTLVNLISDLLASRDSWLPIVMSGQVDQDYLQDSVERLVDESLTQAAERLQPFVGELEDLLDHACRHRETADLLPAELRNQVPDPAPELLPQWKALRVFLIDTKGKFRGSVNKRQGFPAEAEGLGKADAKAQKERFLSLLADMAQDSELLDRLQQVAILPDISAEQADAINRALFAILPLAAAEFDLLCQEVGETDYTAVAMAALDALGTPDNPTPLALRLDYRIEHILVDEFQDTSSMQVELLRRLTAGWQQDDGRTLFIVGDGMQSIYGFRKANVSLFIRARQQGIDQVQMQPLDLSANFRSQAQIVDWVNQSFAQIFPAEDNLVQGQVAFKQAQATQAADSWPIHLQGFASEQQEAEAIAADIAAKQQQGETNLALLVRGRTHLRAILPALRARNIAWQAQKIDRLNGRMAVMDIDSLVRALCIPSDRIAWLSVLRAPWAGLNLADLLALAQWRADDRPAIWTALQQYQQIAELSAEGRQICQRLLQSFQTAFAQLGKQCLRQTVEQLWRALDGPDCALEARDLDDVADYLDLLETLESGGAITDWNQFDRKLAELFARPQRAENAVQIMTIHSAKGLEFDHVYLPALDRLPGGGNESPLLLWWQREFEDGSEAYLLAAKPSLGSDKSQDLYAYLKEEEKMRQRQETARLLYVAATRARKSLFISAKLKWDEKKEEISAPEKRSMLSILWPLYEEQFCRDFEPGLAINRDEVGVLDGIRRLPPNRPLPEIAAPEPAEAPEPASYSYAANYLARIRGDLIHHSLMRIVREQIAQPDSRTFADDWQRGLANRGLSTGEIQNTLTTLGAMLQAILADDCGRWLLDWRHDDSQAELEMDYLANNGGIRRAIIDRTFVENGTRWIVDYKSSAPADGQTLDNFLQQQAEIYRPQLNRYAGLFEQPCKTLLYFPAIPSAIDVT